LKSLAYIYLILNNNFVRFMWTPLSRWLILYATSPIEGAAAYSGSKHNVDGIQRITYNNFSDQSDN
jgi:hypothetical protein